MDTYFLSFLQKEKAQLVCVVKTMCGIVGVVGNTNATDILIQGLEKLEYRGYDSAGIFVLGGAENHLVKAVGRIAELSAKTAGVEGTTGIGHTRCPRDSQLRPDLDTRFNAVEGLR